MNIQIIGDIHGKISQIDFNHNSDYWFCVGDLGFQYHHNKFMELIKDKPNHYLVFGNHDFYPYLDKDYSTGNYKFFPEINLFTIRGANSIDKHLRTENIDWFANEELNYIESIKVLDEYEKHSKNIDIVISHDCPAFWAEKQYGYTDNNHTRKLLDEIYQIHQPKIWVYGHHHRSSNIVFNNTNFICLKELETLNLNI